ncbi:unnamed protein product, partial [Rotaria socialis]
MSTFTFSTTEKNKPLLICKGFAYTIDKTTNDKTYWKCEHVRKFKCKGRIHTNCTHTTLLHENDNHNHPGNPVSTEIGIFEEKIRHQAPNSNEATQNFIDYCLTNLADHAVARLPDFKHVKRNIQNHPVKKDLPEIPHDKTFNATPSIFYQLYAMHVVYRNAVLPVVFALLPNKTQQTHRRLIDKLSEICPLWSPKFIMMDFELASINEFGDKFVTTTNPSIISGCFFIYKIVFNDLGFKTNYEQDPVFSHHVNQIA